MNENRYDDGYQDGRTDRSDNLQARYRQKPDGYIEDCLYCIQVTDPDIKEYVRGYIDGYTSDLA